MLNSWIAEITFGSTKVMRVVLLTITYLVASTCVTSGGMTIISFGFPFFLGVQVLIPVVG